MQTLIKILLSLFLLVGTADARSINVVVGGLPVASGACTEPEAGTVIVGTSTTSTADIAYSGINQQIYFDVNSEASWAETCTTTTVGTLEVYFAGNATGNCKAILANSDGTIVTNGVSNATSVPDWEGNPSWYVFTMGTPPTITKGNNYKIAVVCDTADPIKLPYNDSGSTTLCIDTDNSYATPGTLSCNTYFDTSTTIGGFRGKK